MLRGVTVLGLGIVGLSLSGCGDGIKRFPVGIVNGKVECEGKGVSKVMVYFEPVSSGGAMEIGQMGHAVTNEDGTFSVGTYGTNDGAVAGKHKVRVGQTESTGPCDCSLNSDVVLVQFDVKEGTVNELTVPLPKKAKNEPKGQKSDFGDEPPDPPLKK
jgi:hypothetical protein